MDRCSFKATPLVTEDAPSVEDHPLMPAQLRHIGLLIKDKGHCGE